MPAVAVVLSTFNRAKVVRRAVASVLGQTGGDLELIIVDDGSTDDTPAVLADLEDPRIRVMRQDNGGLSNARNRGAAAATAEWIGFLDDDDWLDPDWSRLLLEAVTEDVAVVCCGARFVNPDGGHEHLQLPSALGPVYDDAVGLFLAGSFIVRRPLFESTGGYAVGLTCSHQTELALRLVPAAHASASRVAVVDRPLVCIERRPPTSRPMSDPTALFTGAQFILEHHRDRLSRERSTLADYHAVAGVSAARLGDLRSARRLLAGAARANPTEPRHLLRLALTVMPPLARRVWHTPDYGRSAP